MTVFPDQVTIFTVYIHTAKTADFGDYMASYNYNFSILSTTRYTDCRKKRMYYSLASVHQYLGLIPPSPRSIPCAIPETCFLLMLLIPLQLCIICVCMEVACVLFNCSSLYLYTQLCMRKICCPVFLKQSPPLTILGDLLVYRRPTLRPTSAPPTE